MSAGEARDIAALSIISTEEAIRFYQDIIRQTNSKMPPYTYNNMGSLPADFVDITTAMQAPDFNTVNIIGGALDLQEKVPYFNSA